MCYRLLLVDSLHVGWPLSGGGWAIPLCTARTTELHVNISISFGTVYLSRYIPTCHDPVISG